MRTLRSMTLFVLAGCAVGPDYSRPDLQVPTGFRMAMSDGDGSLPICPGGICCKTRNCVASFASPWRRTGICSGRWRPLKRIPVAPVHLNNGVCPKARMSRPMRRRFGRKNSSFRLSPTVQLLTSSICPGSWISGACAPVE